MLRLSIALVYAAATVCSFKLPVNAVEATGGLHASEILKPRYFESLGAERKLLKYGPYTAPAMSVNGGMKSTAEQNLTLPCRDCYITGFSAGLEYPNGSYANANTSMWLHHVLLINTNRLDHTCNIGVPERNFAAGNERGYLDLTANGTHQGGYYIAANDVFYMVTDLMNETDEPRQAVLTIDWEYVPAGDATKAFKHLTPFWIDITGSCGSFTSGSEFTPPGPDSFQEPIAPYTTNATGEVRFVVNHLHDGGTHIQVTKNGNLLCDTSAEYGQTPGYISPMAGMPDMAGTSHISSLGGCYDVGATKVGDVWSGEAFYNFTSHPGMMQGTSMAPVMGIAILLIELDS